MGWGRISSGELNLLQQQQQQPGYLDVVLPGFIPGSSNDDFVLTFSNNNGKLNPPGILSIKSAIVSSDSNTAAGNHSAIRLFSRGCLMGLGGETGSLE